MGRRSLLAKAATVVLLTGCAHDGAPHTVGLPDGGQVSGATLTTAVRSLCQATHQAAHDTTGAGTSFYLRSHANLHTLAAALELVDRSRSAKLLEAMYAVEQDIAAKPASGNLMTHLASLSTEAGTGLASLHVPRPSCTMASNS